MTIQDAGANTVTNATGSVNLGMATGPVGGTLTCTTNPVAAVAGVATFAGCKIDKAGTYGLISPTGAEAIAGLDPETAVAALRDLAPFAAVDTL